MLGSDNNWYPLNTFARMGQRIPASVIDTTTSSHSVTAAVPASMSGSAFLAIGTNRVEGSPHNAVRSGDGDIISLTDTTPIPPQIAAYVYIGGSLSSTAPGGNAADFVQIGQAETYGVAADGGIEFQPGTNNFRLTSTIPGDRTFSGNTTFSEAATNTTFAGDAIFNGNVSLGNGGADTVSFGSTVTTNITPNGTHDLGTSSARWNTVYAGTLNTETIAGEIISNSNIPDREIDESKIDPTGSMTGDVLTSTGASSDPRWMAPPIGVAMVDPLPTGAVTTEYPFGVLVSLTATDGDECPRASTDSELNDRYSNVDEARHSWCYHHEELSSHQ